MAYCADCLPLEAIDDFDAIACGDWDRFDGNPEKLAAAKQVAEGLQEKGVAYGSSANEPQVDIGADKEER